MGLEKRAHIEALLAIPRIGKLWTEVHQRAANDRDIDTMYEEFLPVQLETLANHSAVIPGVIEALAHCRGCGLKLGSSSGFARPIMDRLVSLAAKQGLVMDAVVSASEVPAGRPAPWMNFANMQLLDIYPPAAVVVVDDTAVGVAAGRNAGAWSVGVIETGNLFGLTSQELADFPPAERQEKFEAAKQEMLAAGAHFAIDSVASLPALLSEIKASLERGERP
jgi:phosphonoacetaldehyde hydrolase